jgi:hypothetical protein
MEFGSLPPHRFSVSPHQYSLAHPRRYSEERLLLTLRLDRFVLLPLVHGDGVEATQIIFFLRPPAPVWPIELGPASSGTSSQRPSGFIRFLSFFPSQIRDPSDSQRAITPLSSFRSLDLSSKNNVPACFYFPRRLVDNPRHYGYKEVGIVLRNRGGIMLKTLMFGNACISLEQLFVASENSQPTSEILALRGPAMLRWLGSCR